MLHEVTEIAAEQAKGSITETSVNASCTGIHTVVDIS